MEDNKNLCFWRHLCQIGACVDLASQIFSACIMIAIVAEYLPVVFTANQVQWTVLVIFAVPIIATIFIQIIFFASAILMMKIKATEKGGEGHQDALKIANLWRIAQIVILSVAFCPIVHDNLEFCVFEAVIRVPLIYVATKLINELEKGTENQEDPELTSAFSEPQISISEQ